MKQTAPRMLVGAAASNSGKTTFVCGLLRALKRRGIEPKACKCGPDYIDPMFHRHVMGVKSSNLDLFFSSREDVCRLIAQGAQSSDVTVIEGAMGYYDGLAVSDVASAWDVARSTGTPAVLVVDGRGRARSVAAEVAGFAQLREQSMVAGVVLNRVAPALYSRLKGLIEEETGVRVFGYLPECENAGFESRHLGLVTADEVADLQERLDTIADAIEQCVDVAALLELAATAPSLEYEPRVLQKVCDAKNPPVIAIARDEAFCFYYDETLRTLEEAGASLVEFSPLADSALLPQADGLYLGGGYPELHARALSENTTMLASIAEAIGTGMPTIAECGGFMYLHEAMEDAGGVSWPMAGVVEGVSYKTERLSRFGYATLTAREDGLLACKGEKLRAHEFHYWDSTVAGAAFDAQKPLSKRKWECAVVTHTLFAGYPHLYLYSEPEAACRFVKACAGYAQRER